MSRRLTVVQLLPALESGGVERSTVEVAEALVSAGHRAIVVSAGGRLLPALQATGATHLTLDIGRKSPAVLRQYHVPPHLVEAQIEILRHERYSLLRGLKLPRSVVDQLDTLLAEGTTETLLVLQRSPGIGHTIQELGLEGANGRCSVIAVVRGGQRLNVDEGYRDLVLPFPAIESPAFEMRTRWDAAGMLGYLDTWSAVRRCRARTGRDPLRLLAGPLVDAWGEGVRDMRWPLTLKAGRA